jgi:PIN domain nuclease of toxin-antitoxin system
LPVLETDFLKGIIDPKDKLHSQAKKAMMRVRRGEWTVASSALLELDLILKNERIGDEERFDVFNALTAEFPSEMIAPITHSSIATAIGLQKTYAGIRSFYFDSIHIGLAIQADGIIVSSDAAFDRISEVKRISLESL